MFSCKPSEAINNIVRNGFAITIDSNKLCQLKTLQRVLSIDTQDILELYLQAWETELCLVTQQRIMYRELRTRRNSKWVLSLRND